MRWTRGANVMHWLQMLIYIGWSALCATGGLATLGSVTCRYDSEARVTAHYCAMFAAHGVNPGVLSWLGVCTGTSSSSTGSTTPRLASSRALLATRIVHMGDVVRLRGYDSKAKS